MTTPDPDDRVDGGLHEDLRTWFDALRGLAEPVPELELLLARAAFESQDLDAELLALWDSREHPRAVLRGTEPGDAHDEWYLSLELASLSVLVTVTRTGDRRRLDGDVTAPAGAVRLEVEQASGRTDVAVDDVGHFSVDVAAGPMRLRCATGERVVLSHWVTV